MLCELDTIPQQMISVASKLIETINHDGVVCCLSSGECVAVAAALIKGAGGKVLHVRRSCSGRLRPHTPVEQTQINLVRRAHVLTLMKPGDANQCPHSSQAQPLGSYLMSSLIRSSYCPRAPWQRCAGPHLWEAQIMGPTLSSREV